jgi:hypothetical protein
LIDVLDSIFNDRKTRKVNCSAQARTKALIMIYNGSEIVVQKSDPIRNLEHFLVIRNIIIAMRRDRASADRADRTHSTQWSATPATADLAQ